MNALKLKGFRVSKGKTQRDVSEIIEKSLDSYAKKERGEFEFTLNEIVAIAIGLDMNFGEFNAIFFDGKLPYSNIPSNDGK